MAAGIQIKQNNDKIKKKVRVCPDCKGYQSVSNFRECKRCLGRGYIFND